MKLHPINTGNFKLDGGAMFGVVPKTLWERTNPADNNNMCSWSMRCLLIEDGDRLMLIDTGIGDKQSEKFFSYYYMFGDDTLQKSIEALGFGLDQITDVILTHLHFDHCGGAIARNKDGNFRPIFKNATFWSNANHWKWATEPNAREKASFLAENINPIQESGQLKFIERTGKFVENSFPDISFLFVDGHTESQMIPHIKYKGKTIVFMADLLPSTGHIPLPYVMGYDTRPLLTLDEKEIFLNKAANENYILFLEHDHLNECCTLKQTEKGVRLDQTFKLSEAF
ncbi:MBL fold metallo-hydrolase [Putridiphycobacter roseus]|uniref:MBL fold metallo-hydrolase n=1 Tax=Putridiphycobacter roseus TaxID=2219161 RepID=A0A2W1NCK5_9FLAO|nr:MBL fold metallo-hydrolase [Putridiphycobacter roseus]PZE16813.1 MBL fold metallo-hydrolase [Putridiphycobacter roseus]